MAAPSSQSRSCRDPGPYDPAPAATTNGTKIDNTDSGLPTAGYRQRVSQAGGRQSAANLVHFERDESHYHSGGGGYGRYDATGNQFALVLVCRADAVVVCSQVAAGGDEVHVEVCVVVLLKVILPDGAG